MEPESARPWLRVTPISIPVTPSLAENEAEFCPSVSVVVFAPCLEEVVGKLSPDSFPGRRSCRGPRG